jgi:hypothetical protein
MNKGQGVNHPLRPEWGTGEVLDVQGTKIRVNFEHGGVKTLDTTFVILDFVDGAPAVPFRIDIQRLDNLCSRFHADLEHNRKGHNDGDIALRVLADVKRQGQPTATNRNRLLNWCYTDGSVFQAGVALAREICTTIYGSVPPDPDRYKPKS